VGLSAVGTVAAYAAAIVAFGYALVSLYGAVGGRGLAGTVGGYVEQMARRGGAAVVLLAVVAVAAKAVGDLIALAPPPELPPQPALSRTSTPNSARSLSLPTAA
jgi:hypothetical protein